MVKSKAPAKTATPQRESKRTHKPKLIYDPSDSGEQHAASKSTKQEKELGNEPEVAEKPVPGVKKSIAKTSKVLFLSCIS